MPLNEITNKASKFRLHVDLAPEYATLRSSQTSGVRNITHEALRSQGRKCIDLWTNGLIYPVDPLTMAPPSFCNITSLLQFVGDGVHGLHGYCKRLSNDALTNSYERDFYQRLWDKEQQDHKKNIDSLQQQHVQEISRLQESVEILNAKNKELKDFLDVERDRANAAKQDRRNSQRRLVNLKNLPLGYRQRKRKRQSLQNLAAFGGARKRRVRITRDVAGQVVGCEDGHQSGTVLLRHVLKLQEIIKILEDPTCKITQVIRSTIFKDLENMVSPVQIMDACDSAGVSKKGYEALYRVITLAHRAKGILRPLLPTPYSVTMTRKCANSNVASMLGGYRHVEAEMVVSATKGFAYNKFNNIYIDVETLQKAMILYYGLTVEECQGMVVFVLKLDECQIVKGQKLERVSLTLMNRALKQNPEQVDSFLNHHDESSKKRSNGRDYYGVQSDKNIWWLKAFELPTESTDTLRWYLNETGTTKLISLQRNGQTLDVENVGSFTVEWHLAGDLKTIKCMLGCKLGANTMFPCIYCCHTKTEVAEKSKASRKAAPSKASKGQSRGRGCGMSSSVSSLNTGTKRPMQWMNGVMSCTVNSPPTRAEEDIVWNPILDIPLSRVHICTLHARLRIMDKLLKLHINYAWNMEPENVRDECISKLEEALSSVGLHGGAVRLTKDTKKSAPGQDNPRKICMGGSKARHLLSNFHGCSSHTKFELWKAICDCTTYRGNEANLGLKRARPWESLDNMIQLLEKAPLQTQEIASLKAAILTFTRQMVDAWGETHITHYMHILFAHSSYFLDQYGSMAIWSTQGMERSHYQAKATYFKNTRHGGGGKEKSNALVEMFNWFYRTLAGRRRRKDSGPASLLRKVVKNVNVRRVTAWRASTAMHGMRDWFASRKRMGKKWIPLDTCNQN